MSGHDFQLRRDAHGRLVLRTAQGEEHVGVIAVRAFPVAAPDQGIALMSAEGHELAWIERLQPLPDEIAAHVREELVAREFMPQILRLVSVSGFATPSTWQIETDRGPTTLVLRGEEDIRRLAGSMLLIADSQGIQYLIRDLQALDRTSRKLLDRFL